MKGINRELTHSVATPIEYRWRLGDEEQRVNDWLGRRVKISYCGEKRCIACGRRVRKLYQSGYCFPCATTLAETDLCIVRPHECHFHLGTCRDEQFAAAQCMIPHIVYLGVSSQAKVGLTRKNRQFIRWIDQGAVRAMALAEVPTRRAAGELEVEIARDLPDRTDWRKLVRGETTDVDLPRLGVEVAEKLPDVWRAYVIAERTVHEFAYPMLPGVVPKARSLSLEDGAVAGEVVGVRGQYLLFADGALHVRKHAGLLLEIEVM